MTKKKVEPGSEEDCPNSHDPIWRVRALRVLEFSLLRPLTWSELLKWGKEDGGISETTLRNVFAWLAIQNLASFSAKTWKLTKFGSETPACAKCGGFIIQSICRICEETASDRRDHMVLSA